MSKVTIITGGTSGIGRGIAEKILENSALDDILYVSYGHNTEQAEEFLHAQTEENQKKIRLLQADMSSYDEMMKFVSRVKEEASHVDWLINNVGISTYAKYEDYTFDEWTKIVNTNLSVPVFLVKELRPIMTEGGSILFTGSYVLLMALVGLFLGVKMPTLTWTNEIMPIKQGAPVVITLFGGFGYMVLLFVGFMLLPGWMQKYWGTTLQHVEKNLV